MFLGRESLSSVAAQTGSNVGLSSICLFLNRLTIKIVSRSVSQAVSLWFFCKLVFESCKEALNRFKNILHHYFAILNSNSSALNYCLVWFF